MADHARLGRPRRPGRIDVGERVVFPNRRLGRREGVRVSRPVLASTLLELENLVECRQVTEPRQRSASANALAELFVLDERRDGLRVIEQVPALLAAARWVDGCGD